MQEDREHDGSDYDFFCNDTATTEIYTLSLHDALPISPHNTYTHTTYTPTPSPDTHNTHHTHNTPIPHTYTPTHAPGPI